MPNVTISSQIIDNVTYFTFQKCTCTIPLIPVSVGYTKSRISSKKTLTQTASRVFRCRLGFSDVIFWFYYLNFSASKWFSPGDALHNANCADAECPSVCPSVHPSITYRFSIETAKRSKVFSPSDSHTILVFPYQTV